LGQLASLPPLVTSWEVELLKNQLAEAAQGKRFLLQGGDCAERFEECTAESITSKLKILLQMSLVLVQGSQTPVIRVGRFAGQYTEPRSEEFEIRDIECTQPAKRGGGATSEKWSGSRFTNMRLHCDGVKGLKHSCSWSKHRIAPISGAFCFAASRVLERESCC